MRFRDYIMDHLSQIGVYLLCLGLTVMILWLDPEHRIRLVTLSYAAFLATLIAGTAFYLRYRTAQRFYRLLKSRIDAGPDALDWPLEGANDHAQQQVVQLYNTMLMHHREAMTQLVERQADQKDFIDSWVHEIKVPLAATSLLLESIEDQVSENKITALTHQRDQIDFYVDQVLYYSRLDSFSKDYLLQNTALAPIIKTVISNLSNSFIEKHLRFALHGDDQTILSDEKWLQFILMQLVSNAVKYTPEGGEIEATIADTGTEVTLTVSDNGVGIPQDELHRIFEKGFTGSNGRLQNQKSTGLGLFLAAQLAEKLGHRLTVTSVLNQGSHFTLHFPYVSYYADPDKTITAPKLNADDQ